MSRSSLHTLTWSRQHRSYELQTQGQPPQRFRPGEEPAFISCLQAHASFAFVGQAGRLSVRKEARTAGTSYWYAYRKQAGQTSKRYLGATPQLTFARLEQVAKELGSSSSPPSIPEWAGQPGGPLLTSRYAPPRLPLSLVTRTRLLDELEAVFSHPLTIISASAGSGKTTLLSAWVAVRLRPEASVHPGGEADLAVAWLSLEDLDNDPTHFPASCIAALQTCLPSLGHKTLALLHARDMLPLSAILTSLLAEIEQAGKEVILILDDYHVLTDPEIVEAMRFLLDHLPANLHLVLATRIDPELPLSRLRVRGQLLEIRNLDLRFTRAEAASFLVEQMGLPLSEEQVAALQRRTEGWIAGLQLAALSARKREDLSAFVQDFAGSHRFVLDFVRQDILAQLPSPLQDFVQQTSVLTCMNARLCQAVTASPDYLTCQEMLETLERANLFVVPLDDERRWYRFHGLFREALLAQLHASHPQLVPLLHLRAARFYEAAGHMREAISHALAAPDYAYAASLMEQAAPHLWLRGETRIVHTWVLALPDAILRAHVGLVLDATLRLLNAVNLSHKTLYATMRMQLEQGLTKIEGLFHKQAELSLSDAEVALIVRRLFLLRALMEVRGLLKLGQSERMQRLVEASEALPADPEQHWNIIPLLLTFWLTVNLKREGASLIPRLLAARQQMMEAGDPQAAIRVMSWLALTATRATRWHLAYQEALSALTMIEQTGAQTIITGYLCSCLFNTCYAWNRLEEAADWLMRLAQSAHDWQVVELLAMEQVFSVRLALARGDLPPAQQALHQLEALVEQEGFVDQAAFARLLRLQVWLAEGKLDQARSWAAQTTFSEETWSPLRRGELLMLVRVLIALQQYTQAADLLSRFSQNFDQQEERLIALEWMALSVVALCHAGKREHAQEVAARLLSLTEPEHYLRVYLDAGPLMKQALKMFLEGPRSDDAGGLAISMSSVTRILSAFEQEEQRRASGCDACSALLPNKEAPSALLEPLTAQELSVLRQLAAGRSNREIAERLVVSLNTVKTHLKHLYSKLAVNSRLQASTRARELRLL